MRVGALDRLQVVDKHVLYRLEIDGSTRARLRRLDLIGVVIQAVLRPVENEPAPVPLAYLAAEFGEVAVAGGGRDVDVRTLGQVVAARLDEVTQVQRPLLAKRQVTRQRSSRRLETTIGL